MLRCENLASPTRFLAALAFAVTAIPTYSQVKQSATIPNRGADQKSRLHGSDALRSLDKQLAALNSKHLARRGITIRASLNSRDDLTVTISNRGRKPVIVFKPRFDYSFWLRFYSSKGKPMAVSNSVAINHVNTGEAGLVQLKPGESYSDITESRFWVKHFKSLKGVTWIAVQYDGSGYPSKLLTKKVKAEVLMGKLFSNSIELNLRKH